MTQEHRLDRNYFTQLPKDFVIPVFEESRGSRYRNLMPDPAAEDGGAAAGDEAGDAPDPAADGGAGGAPDPAAGDGAGDRVGPAAGDGAGDGIGPAGDETSPADDMAGGGAVPAGDGAGRDGGFAASEPEPGEDGGSGPGFDGAGDGTEPGDARQIPRWGIDSPAMYSVRTLYFDLDAVTAILDNFRAETDLDLLYHEVSNMLWDAIENWEKRFPHKDVEIATFRGVGDDAKRFLVLEQDLQNTERHLRTIEQEPDTDAHKNRVLAYLRSQRTALKRAIRELIANHHVDGEADREELEPMVSPASATVLHDGTIMSVDSLLHEIDRGLHDLETTQEMQAAYEAEFFRKTRLIDRLAAEQVLNTIQNSEEQIMYERAKEELMAKPGSIMAALTEARAHAVDDLETIEDELRIIVEFETPAQREASLRRQQNKASKLMEEVKQLDDSTDEILRFVAEVSNSLYASAATHFDDQDYAASGADVDEQDVYYTGSSNRSVDESDGDRRISILQQDIEQDLTRCEEYHEKAQNSLSVLKKLDQDFDSQKELFLRNIEWERVLLDAVIRNASLLVKAGRRFEKPEVRTAVRQTAYSSQETFIGRLRADVVTLTTLSRNRRDHEQLVLSLVCEIMPYIEYANAQLRKLPGIVGESGVASRLRTLLSRPALYKAWVRASLADLGHAQVHAPAGPEHAPGAAAQPAARHPGVSGAAAGAGHV
jgi:hypothetical protein